MSPLAVLAVLALASTVYSDTLDEYNPAELSALTEIPLFMKVNVGDTSLYCIRETCEDAVVSPCAKADILIVLDTSYSITTANVTHVKNKLRDFVSNFNIGPETVRIAGITFGTYARKSFSFVTGSTLADAQQQISDMMVMQGSTALHRAVDGITTAFNPKPGYEGLYDSRYLHADVHKFAIIITDGNPTEPEKMPARLAALNELTDLDRYVVGTGNANFEYLNLLAPKPEHLIYAANFDQALVDAFDSFLQTMCSN